VVQGGPADVSYCETDEDFFHFRFLGL
jgi:hypothetical protein